MKKMTNKQASLIMDKLERLALKKHYNKVNNEVEMLKILQKYLSQKELEQYIESYAIVYQSNPFDIFT